MIIDGGGYAGTRRSFFFTIFCEAPQKMRANIIVVERSQKFSGYPFFNETTPQWKVWRPSTHNAVTK